MTTENGLRCAYHQHVPDDPGDTYYSISYHRCSGPVKYRDEYRSSWCTMHYKSNLKLNKKMGPILSEVFAAIDATHPELNPLRLQK